jgi:hypothetical protein
MIITVYDKYLFMTNRSNIVFLVESTVSSSSMNIFCKK